MILFMVQKSWSTSWYGLHISLLKQGFKNITSGVPFGISAIKVCTISPLEVWTRLRGVSFTTWSSWTSCGDRGSWDGSVLFGSEKVFWLRGSWCGDGRSRSNFIRFCSRQVNLKPFIHILEHWHNVLYIDVRILLEGLWVFELCCIVKIRIYINTYLPSSLVEAFGEMQRHWKWVRCSSPTQRDPFPWWRCRLQKRWWVGMIAWSDGFPLTGWTMFSAWPGLSGIFASKVTSNPLFRTEMCRLFGSWGPQQKAVAIRNSSCQRNMAQAAMQNIIPPFKDLCSYLTQN